jgi:hypothetical protein
MARSQPKKARSAMLSVETKYGGERCQPRTGDTRRDWGGHVRDPIESHVLWSLGLLLLEPALEYAVDPGGLFLVSVEDSSSGDVAFPVVIVGEPWEGWEQNTDQPIVRSTSKEQRETKGRRKDQGRYQLTCPWDGPLPEIWKASQVIL